MSLVCGFLKDLDVFLRETCQVRHLFMYVPLQNKCYALAHLYVGIWNFDFLFYGSRYVEKHVFFGRGEGGGRINKQSEWKKSTKNAIQLKILNLLGYTIYHKSVLWADWRRTPPGRPSSTRGQTSRSMQRDIPTSVLMGSTVYGLMWRAIIVCIFCAHLRTAEKSLFIKVTNQYHEFTQLWPTPQ